MTDLASSLIDGYFSDTERILTALRPQLQNAFPRLAFLLDTARCNGRTIFVMGNGGSAAAASHLANDLNKYTIVDRQRRYKCLALTDSAPLIMAWANDAAYSEIFVEQLRNLMEPGDVLVGISGSGNSLNCVKAMQYAREVGGTTVSWTGYGGGRMAEYADLSIVIPSDSMVHCEDAHVVIHHCLVTLLKAELEAIVHDTLIGPAATVVRAKPTT
ncbi:MAG TPA: SIS domain-containing protein [Thermoanaerobaculia bacterium]|jgi:D-sedoheptulose 7-phosphate isomerase|nr:SIS domain-containing protein [Thermoanaerobaculia bacterium]